MIKVRVEVLGETGCCTVAVCAESLRRATQIAQDLYPGSAVRIPFPIGPEDFFDAKPGRDDQGDLEVVSGEA